jgi:hypothetical protein
MAEDRVEGVCELGDPRRLSSEGGGRGQMEFFWRIGCGCGAVMEEREIDMLGKELRALSRYGPRGATAPTILDIRKRFRIAMIRFARHSLAA